MLFPKITKFSKNFSRKKAQIKEKSRPLFRFSSVGLMSENSSFLVQQQLSAFLRVLRKNLKKRAKIWLTFSPNIPVTKKPQDVRMGKGKGVVKYWAFLMKKYTLLLEIKGVNYNLIQKNIKLSKIKLPFKSKIISKQ